jgi:UDP-3-O-[3-hydroxymyristoyl] glucosamine N-acyltransferase
MKIPSTKIASYLNLEHDGKEIIITGVGSLDSAEPHELAFCLYDNKSYISASEAKVVICPPAIPSLDGKTLIRSTNPRLDFVIAVNEYFKQWPSESQIHPTAVIADEADIGEQCVIGPNVYIAPNVTVGDRTKIQAGTSIGGEGFGFEADDDGELHGQIHEGEVVIGDEVEMGSNCSVDRAVFDTTRIGDGTKMDNLIHIAHNVTIGEDVWIADTAAIQGSVTIGDRVRIHPNCSIADHSKIGEGAEIAMCSAVLDEVDEGEVVAGVPAEPIQ